MNQVIPPKAGEKFGKLTVLSVKNGQKKPNTYSTICQCDCGNKIKICFGQLKNRVSCGECYKNYLGELIGKRFTNLVVESTYSKNWRTRCICKCDCGKQSDVALSKLNNKTTKSCGCHLYNKSVPGESSRHELIKSYQRNAKKRNYAFELSDEQMHELFQGKCYYCNSEPSTIYYKKQLYGSYVYNGVDRIDNLKGYTIDNAVSCCKYCNWMKSKYSQNIFLDKIKKIYNHRCKDN